MKKTSLAVALPALALTGLLLSGCGMFRSERAWQNAKQESPLEIPPGLDTPSATAALVIPPAGGNQPSANGATARVGSNPGTITDGFILADSVDETYRRVGEALANGDIGTLQGHDDAAHTYNLSVMASDQPTEKPSFLARMFGKGSSSSGPNVAPRPVVVSVNTSGKGSSEVRAQGDAAAVAKVVDSLKSRLGGKG
ncbi:hypothetical protein [Dyella caseinilytica]|uniref:Lipoprotein n=1 Tax=Dyella caseinilytica TaxID=1849581 RepID=A0ABX7H0J1_9GAMM|nr:hypothetical protein [Dyella caseinilytica]QRN54935.1 hypothetical protein ISN74_06190 [Dyella caseinilytica]GFZ98054.1 hypothetical protein GCM10011408_18260 [Dyella caseinilytica]